MTSTGSGQVTAFQINALTGALTLIGSVSTGPGSAPEGIATYQAGSNEYVYVALSGLASNNVAAFQIGPTGALIANGAGTLPGGVWDTFGAPAGVGSPADLVAAGGLLYVTDDAYDGSVPGHGLTVFPISGTGTLGAPASFTTGAGPLGIAIDTTNGFLYVANQIDGSASAYPLGNLSAPVVVPLAAGLSQPVGVTADPVTGAVYISDVGNNGVWGFTAGLAAPISGVTPSANGNTGTGSQPGYFLLSHAPPVPFGPGVPASSTTSLAVLAVVLAGGAGLFMRRRQPSAR